MIITHTFWQVGLSMNGIKSWEMEYNMSYQEIQSATHKSHLNFRPNKQSSKQTMFLINKLPQKQAGFSTHYGKSLDANQTTFPYRQHCLVTNSNKLQGFNSGHKGKARSLTTKPPTPEVLFKITRDLQFK